MTLDLMSSGSLTAAAVLVGAKRKQPMLPKTLHFLRFSTKTGHQFLAQVERMRTLGAGSVFLGGSCIFRSADLFVGSLAVASSAFFSASFSLGFLLGGGSTGFLKRNSLFSF